MTNEEKLAALRKAQEDLKQQYDYWRQSEAFTGGQCQALLNLIRYTLGDEIFQLRNAVEQESWGE